VIAFLQNTLIFATQREQLRLLLDQGIQDLLALTQRRFLLVQYLLDPGKLLLTLGRRQRPQGDGYVA
jgi:hypothetical protein